MQTDFSISPINEVFPVRSSFTVAGNAESTSTEVNQQSITEQNSSPRPTEEPKEVDLKSLQQVFESHNITLKFSQDEKTNALVVQLINQQTGETLRQIPSDVSLKLAAELGKLQGLLYSRKA
jgi:flagellar protein FlaG